MSKQEQEEDMGHLLDPHPAEFSDFLPVVLLAVSLLILPSLYIILSSDSDTVNQEKEMPIFEDQYLPK